LALVAVLGLVAAACGGGKDNSGGTTGTQAETSGSKIEDRAPGGTLVYAADQEPTGFNGLTSKDNGTSVKNVIENLFFYAVKANPDFSLNYVGLEGEPKLVSEGPQVVEWKINKDAAWDDGTPVTSDDLKYNLEQTELKDPTKVTDENPKGYVHDVATHVGYDQITKFEVVDAKTFRATFDPPYADYRGSWTDIAQAKFMKAQPGGWDTGLDAAPGPSAGPYKLKEWKKGESLTLEKNTKYWGKIKPTLDTIVFRFLPESTTQQSALRNNEVDMIYPQPQLDLVDEVKQLTDVKSEVGFGPVFEHLTFNFQNEFLKDLAVRQAIAYGVDRNAIVAALMKPFSDKAARLDNRVLVATQKGYKANGKEYQTANVTEAQDVLTKAGYTKGADGMFAKGGKKIVLRISTTAGNKTREDQGELIKAQLAKVGIEIKIDNSPSKILFGTRLPGGDFDIANFAWVGTPFPLSGSKQIYETGGDSNYGKYSNADFDKLAKQAASELDATKALDLADQEDVVMWKDLVNLPLYQKPTFLGIRTKYVNIKDNATSEGPFFNSNEWGLKKTAA
jgi:peptide/nickel transport system substrate-binding protein